MGDISNILIYYVLYTISQPSSRNWDVDVLICWHDVLPQQTAHSPAYPESSPGLMYVFVSGGVLTSGQEKLCVKADCENNWTVYLLLVNRVTKC